ncbi:LysR family transcriptional regulator [Methylobacterium sp. E-045]|uniref:LysR family transcriptional regulator n=1 Tax=Methylobacterium sp. E-045 TaxID=2836575 RepID=UPI001FBAAD2D|nr:LysR family transcriptional regulator [Methylobacterium sp. E-045]MCJ2130796.1 LysR family transcriptional regulator [Methylobacterium sp. E-045]
MDVRWLQDFVALAEIGNFTRAAEVRHSSQAAFSRRIQSLEHWLGTTLIDRTAFPTRLTPAGRRFSTYATEILGQVADARGELAGTPTRDHVRLALPYAIATASLPKWWHSWSRDRALSCSLVSGNVHDMITALIAGSVDILICFTTAQQPIQLDPDQYIQRVIHQEELRPYASPKLLKRGGMELPGSATKPLPLLMYSSDVYFSRLVELILEAAPRKLIGRRVIESDMADVLRDMAVAGHGIAWLPDSAVEHLSKDRLIPVDDGSYSLPIQTVAFRSAIDARHAVVRLWDRLGE